FFLATLLRSLIFFLHLLEKRIQFRDRWNGANLVNVSCVECADGLKNIPRFVVLFRKLLEDTFGISLPERVPIRRNFLSHDMLKRLWTCEEPRLDFWHG